MHKAARDRRRVRSASPLSHPRPGLPPNNTNTDSNKTAARPQTSHEHHHLDAIWTPTARLLVDLAREVDDLHVPAAAPALADKALRGRVQGHERAGRGERAHDAFERVERAAGRVDVGLRLIASVVLFVCDVAGRVGRLFVVERVSMVLVAPLTSPSPTIPIHPPLLTPPPNQPPSSIAPGTPRPQSARGDAARRTARPPPGSRLPHRD